MFSLSNDIARNPKQKTDLDTLTGKVTIHDFKDQISELIPNFINTTSCEQRITVGESLKILHELAYMPGDPFDETVNVHDESLPEYLHSLLLGIQANKDRIEAIYAPID